MLSGVSSGRHSNASGPEERDQEPHPGGGGGGDLDAVAVRPPLTDAMGDLMWDRNIDEARPRLLPRCCRLDVLDVVID